MVGSFTRTWVTAPTSFPSWMMGERPDRCRWQRKGGERVAAVDKIEEKRKPEDFIGHRNRRAGHECVNIGPTNFCIVRFQRFPVYKKESHRISAIPLYDRLLNFCGVCYIRTNKSKPIAFSLLSLFFFFADITFPPRYYCFSVCFLINNPYRYRFINPVFNHFITLSVKAAV